MRRVELTDRADAVMVALPDDAHEEVLGVIDGVADTQGGVVAAFGASSWVTCGVEDAAVVVLDVGWLD